MKVRKQFWLDSLVKVGWKQVKSLGGMYECTCTSRGRQITVRFGPIPVAARSKAWVCVRLLAGIVASNPAEGMDVCLL
jgi:hypothetical protein